MIVSALAHEDLVERAEAVCKEAEAAVLANEPGAQSALALAKFLKGVALARRILNGGVVKTFPVETSAQRCG